MFNKVATKNILLISATVSLVAIIWDYIGNYKLCDLLSFGSTGDCPNTLAGIEPMLFIFFGVLVFSLVTYFLNDVIFRTWARFALFWVVLSIFLTVLTQDNYGSFIGWSKTTTALCLTMLFMVVSAVLVIMKNTQVRRH